jgi:uncharacterized protein YjbI with pentapeptide repeats
MANEEHVARLKQGVDAWNAWRRETPDARPDLHGADLRGAHLMLANLSGAILRGAASVWALGLKRSGLRPKPEAVL